jgi:hypothetical protein
MGQHRVSEFYLRGFTQRKGPRLLFEYSKATGAAWPITPKKASAESATAFSIEAPNPNIVESFLGAVEHRAKPVFDKIRIQLPLTDSDRIALSQFAALTYVRSTRTAENFENIRSLFTMNAIEDWLKGSGVRIDWMLQYPSATSADFDRAIDKFISNAKQAGYIPRPAKNRQFSLLDYQQDWIDILLKMRWRVGVAPEGTFFVVGDEPLCARKPHDVFSPTYAPIADRDSKVEVTFPLSRRMCLLADWLRDPVDLFYANMSADVVREINIRTVLCSHKVFWSPACSDDCAGYIQTVGGRSVEIPTPPTLHEFFETYAANTPKHASGR